MKLYCAITYTSTPYSSNVFSSLLRSYGVNAIASKYGSYKISLKRFYFSFTVGQAQCYKPVEPILLKGDQVLYFTEKQKVTKTVGISFTIVLVI